MTSINLTPGQDTIDVSSSVTRVWINGDSATYNASDSVTGNNLTTLKLTLDDSATVGAPTVEGVGDVQVALLGDVTLNAANYSDVGEIALVHGGVSGSQLTIENGSRATVFAIDAAHAEYDLSLNLTSGTGAAQLSLDGSGVWGAHADAIDLSFGGSAVSIDAVGWGNFDSIDLGGGVNTVEVVGAGLNDLQLSNLAATFALDASGSKGWNTFQFASGVLDNSDSVTGGTGWTRVIADGFSGAGVELNLTGVNQLVTSFTDDVTFNGTDIAGLRTIIATDIGAGGVTLTDMTNDFSYLTIKGDVGAVSVGYGETTPAAHLTVTYATGPDSSPQAFDGLGVDNVTAVTVNFRSDVDMTGATGAISLDDGVTSALTLNSAGGHDAYVYLAEDAALTNLTVEATSYRSAMELQNNPSEYAFESTRDVAAISIRASGQSSEARIDTTGDNAILVEGHLTTMTITASGKHAFAGATADFTSPTYPATIGAENGIGAIALTACGASSEAHVSGEVGIGEAGDIGSLALTASAANASAEIAGEVAGVIAYSGDLEGLTITASGVKSDAEITVAYSSVAVGALEGHGETTAGNVGPVTMLASATSSDALISGAESGIYASNSVGAVSVTASAQHANASIEALYGVYADTGDIGAVTVIASGVLSHASIDDVGEGAGVYANQNVGAVQVVASGTSAHAQISGGDYGIYAYSSIGGTAEAGISITASHDQASAEIYGLSAAIYAQSGDIGPVSVTASGVGAEAGVNGAFTGPWAGRVGANGVFVEAGSIGAITVTASGTSSDAHIAAWSGTAVFAANGIASLTNAASGDNSSAWIASHGSSAVSSSGSIGALDITATGSYADAAVHAYDGTGVRSGSTIASLTLTASGAHSEASIFGGGLHNEIGNDAVDAYSTLGAVTVTASGAHSLASIDSPTLDGVYVGGTIDGYALTSVTLLAGSALDAHASIKGHDDGVYVGSGDVDTISLTASGNGAAGSEANHAYALISGGDSGVYIGEGGVDSVTLAASGTYSEAGIDGAADYGLYAYSSVTEISLTASGAHSSAYIAGYSGIHVEGNVGTISVTASGVDSEAGIYTSDVDSVVTGTITQISVAADGAGSHADLDWLDVTGVVGEVDVAASAAGSSAYATIDMGAEAHVSAVSAAAGTGAEAEYIQSQGEFGTITVVTGAAGHGGAAGGGVTLHLDDLNAQTYDTSGGIINASGAQNLTVGLYDDGESFSSLNAGSMSGNVTVSVQSGSGDQGMTITTGSGNDDVQVGTGENTLNLGTGHDAYDFRNVVVVSSPSALLPATGADNLITASGWTASDSMVFAGANGAASGAYLTIGDNATTFGPTGTLEAQADTALATHSGLEYVFGTSGGNGYLFFDPSHDNTDTTATWEFQQAVELAGVTTFNPSQIHGVI